MSAPAGTREEDADRIIVVSDLHLGMKCSERTVEDFSEFIQSLTQAKKEGKPLIAPWAAVPGGCHEGRSPVEIHSPSRFILLGDIVDLWDPRGQDRINVIRDLIRPFNKLRDLDCDLVYVAGNHDEDIIEFIDPEALYELPVNLKQQKPEPGSEPSPRGNPAPEQREPGVENSGSETMYKMPKYVTLPWTDNSSFKLCSRHFPEDGPELTSRTKYLGIGDVKYYFVHGQQYDKEQVTYTLSRIFNRRFDPVDTLTDLANVSFTRSLSMGWHIFLLAVWLISIFALFTGPVSLGSESLAITPEWLQFIIGLFFGLVIPVILLKQYGSSKNVLEKRKVKGFRKHLYSAVFLVIPLIVIFGIILPPITIKFTGIIIWVFLAGTALLTLYGIVCCVPRLITSLMRLTYETLLKSRDLYLRDMVKEGHFRTNEDDETCDVIVFGHTHVADCLFVLKEGADKKPGFIQECFPCERNREPITESVGKPKLLINTGSWQYAKDRYTNTFAYIDRKGVSLLSYSRGGNVTCLCNITSGDIRKKLGGNSTGIPPGE